MLQILHIVTWTSQKSFTQSVQRKIKSRAPRGSWNRINLLCDFRVSPLRGLCVEQNQYLYPRSDLQRRFSWF